MNFEASRLELTDSNTGRKFVYLPAPALAVLRELERVDGNPHVIVGGKAGAPLVNLKERPSASASCRKRSWRNSGWL